MKGYVPFFGLLAEQNTYICIDILCDLYLLLDSLIHCWSRTD